MRSTMVEWLNRAASRHISPPSSTPPRIRRGSKPFRPHSLDRRLSPHLDDAVLSCWSLIDSDEDVTVVTVFSGAPESGFVSPWDADSGVDSATRMAQRVAENRAALAVAGREAVDVGLPECGYPAAAAFPSMR
jgi:hypothetical protein